MQINKSSYSGGKFVYKKWGVKDGARAANRCKRNQKPDLQSTYLYNPDDSEVLRYVRIDVDAKYTSFYFKDENGAVSWPKIAQEIKEKCPDLLKHVEYVTLSQSKQGLHILIGIGPLPLNDKTIKAQLLARKIQSNIISVFNELGIGADPAGKGLKQDFSTYRNSKNTIHHNQILTRKIEHEAKLRSYVDEQGNNVIPIQRRPRLNELHQILEETMKDLGIKNMYRLYNDLRVERPIARLYLYMMGIHDKNLKLEVPSYPAWENQLELSIEDIELITGTDRRNFSNFIKTEDFKKLFIIYKVSGLFESSRYRFSIIQTSTVHKRCDRARQVLSISSNSIKFN